MCLKYFEVLPPPELEARENEYRELREKIDSMGAVNMMAVEEYQEAEDLGPDFNGPGISSFEAFISPDESFLLIGSFGRQPTFGSSDLYIAYNQNGTWTKPKNLGPVINTKARDYSPRLSGDGKWLLYTGQEASECFITVRRREGTHGAGAADCALSL